MFDGNSNHDDPILRFGKHKGKAISEIPVEYLDWLIGEDWFWEQNRDLAQRVETYLAGCAEWRRLRYEI